MPLGCRELNRKDSGPAAPKTANFSCYYSSVPPTTNPAKTEHIGKHGVLKRGNAATVVNSSTTRADGTNALFSPRSLKLLLIQLLLLYLIKALLSLLKLTHGDL